MGTKAKKSAAKHKANINKKIHNREDMEIHKAHNDIKKQTNKAAKTILKLSKTKNGKPITTKAVNTKGIKHKIVVISKSQKQAMKNKLANVKNLEHQSKKTRKSYQKKS